MARPRPATWVGKVSGLKLTGSKRKKEKKESIPICTPVILLFINIFLNCSVELPSIISFFKIISKIDIVVTLSILPLM